MSLWRQEGLSLSVIAVNLSLFQLKCGQDLVRDVVATTTKWGLQPGDLEFDVTEQTLAQLKWAHNEVLPQLRELGVKIAIDNFGSEYSCFDYVRAYRVNHLKIAQSFINQSTTDPECAATVRAIVNFARDLGIAVIAQGVETEGQSDLLTLTSADPATQGQGFHFGKAVGAEQAGELLRQSKAVSVEALPPDTTKDSPAGVDPDGGLPRPVRRESA